MEPVVILVSTAADDKEELIGVPLGPWQETQFDENNGAPLMAVVVVVALGCVVVVVPLAVVVVVDPPVVAVESSPSSESPSRSSGSEDSSLSLRRRFVSSAGFWALEYCRSVWARCGEAAACRVYPQPTSPTRAARMSTTASVRYRFLVNWIYLHCWGRFSRTSQVISARAGVSRLSLRADHKIALRRA